MSKPDNYWTEQNQRAEFLGGAIASIGCFSILAIIGILLIIGALL